MQVYVAGVAHSTLQFDEISRKSNFVNLLVVMVVDIYYPVPTADWLREEGTGRMSVEIEGARRQLHYPFHQARTEAPLYSYTPKLKACSSGPFHISSPAPSIMTGAIWTGVAPSGAKRKYPSEESTFRVMFKYGGLKSTVLNFW